MAILSLLVACSAPILTGASVIAWLPPAERRVEQNLRRVVAVLLGFALHSLWYFVWAAGLMARATPRRLIAIDVLLPLLALGLRLAFRPPYPRRWPAASLPPQRLPLLLAPAIAIGVVAAARIAVDHPHGGWDAWAIWNLKARWLAAEGAWWPAILTDPAFADAHPDYPLLLPASIARVWSYLGSTDVAVPQALAIGSALAVLALLTASTWALRGPLTAVAAAAGLLTVPSFFVAAAAQTADLPLAAYYLLTLTALAIGVARGHAPVWMVVAGMAAGGAAWTKNEGLLFALCAVVSLAVVTRRATDDRRTLVMRAGSFLLGACPFLVATAAIKLIAPANVLIAGSTSHGLSLRLVDMSRQTEIVSHGAAVVSGLQDQIGLLLFAVFLVLRGRAVNLQPALAVLLTLALTAVGYDLVFQLTPLPLSWHLATAGERLFLQLWPSLVFGAALLGPAETPAASEPAAGP